MNSGFPSIWINSRETMPNTCIACGMFSDHRIKTSFSQKVETTVQNVESNGKVALGCLAHLLGPIGWAILMMLNGNENRGSAQKTVRQSGKIKVPCCRLCAGTSPPTPTSGRPDANLFQFDVHPKFQQRLEAIRTESPDS